MNRLKVDIYYKLMRYFSHRDYVDDWIDFSLVAGNRIDMAFPFAINDNYLCALRDHAMLIAPRDLVALPSPPIGKSDYSINGFSEKVLEYWENAKRSQYKSKPIIYINQMERVFFKHGVHGRYNMLPCPCQKRFPCSFCDGEFLVKAGNPVGYDFTNDGYGRIYDCAYDLRTFYDMYLISNACKEAGKIYEKEPEVKVCYTHYDKKETVHPSMFEIGSFYYLAMPLKLNEDGSLPGTEINLEEQLILELPF